MDRQLNVAVKLQWRGDSGECILIFDNDILWSAWFSWTGSCGRGEGTEVFGQQQDCVLYDGSGGGREATNRPGRGFKTKVSIRSIVIQSRSVSGQMLYNQGHYDVKCYTPRSVSGQMSYNQGQYQVKCYSTKVSIGSNIIQSRSVHNVTFHKWRSLSKCHTFKVNIM